MTLAPLTDHVLVAIEPRKESKGLIYFPEESRVLTGVVRAVGPGRWKKGKCRRLEVEVGERVAFFRENLEHMLGRAVTGVLSRLADENLGLLRESDVLFVMGPGFNAELS